MRRRKTAFTLIEVMVVLSILALVAALAYTLFGNTLKEARDKANVTEVYRGLTTLSNAIEKYRLDEPLSTLSATGYQSDGTLQTMAISNSLKGLPSFPAAALTTCADPKPGWRASVSGWSFPGFGTATKDDWVSLVCVTPEFAKLYNQKYAPSLGYAVHNSLNGTVFLPPTQESTYCYMGALATYACVMYVAIH